MTAADDQDRDLLARAEALLEWAYGPYSGIAVAAALLAEDGRIMTGVNVENASLGLTLCAERTALAAAVAAGLGPGRPGGRITGLVFTSNSPSVTVPCGACRQVIAELAPEARLAYGRNGRILRRWSSIRELLPEAFDGRWKDAPA
jgi:cytidine deaminase